MVSIKSTIRWFIPILIINFISAKDPFKKDSKTCQPIAVDSCKFSKNTGYAFTLFPNNDHRTQAEADRDLKTFAPLKNSKCHADIDLFLCARYIPLCIEDLKISLKPCRALCEQVKSGCEKLMNKFGHEWPFNCTQYPGPGEVCVSGSNAVPITTTATVPMAVNVTMTTNATSPPNKGKPKRKRGKVTGGEGDKLEIRCKKGQSIIIKKVTHKDSKCCQSISRQILAIICHRRKTCRFDVSQNTFGGHCFGKVGSVAVKYRCEKNKKKNKRQSEKPWCPMKR